MSLDPLRLLEGLGTGACGGVLSGLFGVGGGVVMVPLLALVLHLDQHRAQGATLAAMLLPTGLPAVLEYRRRGVASSVPLVGVLILGFLMGVTVGALLANRVPPGPMRWGFALFLLGIAVHTYRRPEVAVFERSGEPFRVEGVWSRGWPIGLGAGILSGLTGLGGAVVVVPLLASRFRMTQHEAQLASLMMLLPPIGLPGVVVYAKAQGGLPWAVLGAVAVGFMGGALVGARLATRLPGARLKRVFAAVILLMALLVVFRSA